MAGAVIVVVARNHMVVIAVRNDFGRVVVVVRRIVEPRLDITVSAAPTATVSVPKSAAVATAIRGAVTAVAVPVVMMVPGGDDGPRRTPCRRSPR